MPVKIVDKSAEHHLLTFLEKIKQSSEGWMVLRCALSEKLVHAAIVEPLDHIKGKIFQQKKESDQLLKEISAGAAVFSDATLYQFADGDLILLCTARDSASRTAFHEYFRDLAGKVGGRICTATDLSSDLYGFQKVADERMISLRRMSAYEAMGDSIKVASLPLRRERRTDNLVLVVEDDRFTASYAANILNKDHELVLAKTGEEAITAYIEHAPDIVFLDIHLPGLSGLDTLLAIRKLDPKAHVVMLSVDTVEKNIKVAQGWGAAGFLKKPFTKDRILGMVQKSPYYRKPKG